MIRNLGILLVVFAALMQGHLFAKDPVLPASLVPFATGRIEPDGKLDEPAWKAAEWSRDFVWIDAGDKAPVRARFKTLYDRTSLHFAFEYDSPILPEIPLDPDLPRACEIFLDPEGRGGRYWEYAVSPEGDQHSLVWSGRLSIRDWSSEPGATTKVGIQRVPTGKQTERITFEMSFPWKSLANVTGGRTVPPARGDAWRANFSRVEPNGDFVWAPAGFYYMHHPNTFGWLVFAGEKDPLRDTASVALKPLPDDTTQLKIGKEFEKLNGTHWVSFPVSKFANGDWLIANKTSLERQGPQGERRYTLTRRDGLPQFTRSLWLQGDKVYAAGNGLKAGLVEVDATGRVRGVDVASGYQLSGVPTLFPLSSGEMLAVANDQYQWFRDGRFAFPQKAAGKIQTAVALEHKVLLGTADGIELHNQKGAVLAKRLVAGGIVQLVPVTGAALGASSKTGLYLINTEGGIRYFPSPLRFKIDSIHVDPQGRCWCGYVGGLLVVENRQVQYFPEPLGLTGFRILGAATGLGGETVFLATIPHAPWYRSSWGNSFLLVHDNGKWKRITYADGLPGHVSALTQLDGRFLLSTTMGVFEYVRQQTPLQGSRPTLRQSSP